MPLNTSFFIKIIMASVVVNDPKSYVGQAVETTVIDLGRGYYLTTSRNYGQVTGVYYSGGGVTPAPPSTGEETLISSEPAKPSEEARRELAKEISAQEKREAEQSGRTDTSGTPMIYRRRELGAGMITEELTYPRTKEEVYKGVYDVYETKTISETTPFTKREGANFVQIIPSGALIEHEGQVVPLSSVYTPDDLRQSIYTAKIGQEPSVMPSGTVIDITGAAQSQTTEELILGRYQVQKPGATQTEAMSFGSMEYVQSVKYAKDVEFHRWYESLTPSQRWEFEAQVIAGTTLLTLPLASTGVAMLPRVAQLGLAYGSSVWLSYDIIKGTEREGLNYLTRPQFVVGIPVAVASGWIGFKLASRYGLVGALNIKPETVKATQSVVGIEEVGGKGTGIVKVQVKTDYSLGGGWRGQKMKISEISNKILFGEDLRPPYIRKMSLPEKLSFGGKFSEGYVTTTGRVSVLDLGGTRTITTKGILGGTKVRTENIPIQPSEEFALFNQAEGIAHFPTFKAQAKYSEFGSTDLTRSVYGRVISLSTDKVSVSYGVSRELIGRQYDIYTKSIGATINVPETPYVPPKFTPTITTPKSTTYIGIGDLSNQPLSTKAFNQAIGIKPTKAVSLIASDKSFIKSLRAGTTQGATTTTQQPTLTVAQAKATIHTRSFAQPTTVSRTASFDYMSKIISPPVKVAQQRVSEFPAMSPLSAVSVKQKQFKFALPTLSFKPAQRQRREEGLFPLTTQIQLPETSQKKANLLASTSALKTIQKTRPTAVPFSFPPAFPVIKPPTIKLPFPSLSLKLRGDKFKAMFKGFRSIYQPTLYAKEFKIFGKQPKIITGMEVFRPMLRSSRKKKSKMRK